MNLINNKRGLVTKKFNNFFYVDILDPDYVNEVTRYLCKSRKSIFYKKNLIFVGDEVMVSNINKIAKTATIESLLKRKNLLLRPAVANISDIYIINSVSEPKLNYAQLSDFLINAESLQVKVSLILTKSDLISYKENIFLYEKFKNWGYESRIFSLTSSPRLTGFIDELSKKKCSIFVGPSGVGKTSLLNLIIPNLNRATSAISNKIKRGKNTTRNIELFRLSKENYIVDTPGFNIKNKYIEPREISHLFPEINSQINENTLNCKFRNCLHIDEPGCNLNKDFERYEFYKNHIQNTMIRYPQNQGD